MDCTYGLEGTVESSGLTHTAHLTEKCTVCGYINNLGDVKVTIPQLTYGETAGTSEKFKFETDIQFGLFFRPAVCIDNAGSDGDAFENKLAGLSAGEYEDKLRLRIYYPVDAKPGGAKAHYFPIPFTIDPAPLTGDMVELAQEDITYTGAAQKPAVTVKQGTTTLTEGTDYTVSYSGIFYEQVGLSKSDCVIICGDMGGIWDGSAEEWYWLDWSSRTL